MKQQLRKLFSPLLNRFETGNEAFVYKASHRKILVIVSCLFSGLAALILVLSQGAGAGYLFPAIVFGLIGLTGLIVGLLGTDRAVAKIWGNR